MAQDNVDKVMEKYDYIVYPSRTIQTDGIKAFSVTSFGFGQKGTQAIGIHPKYLFATLDEAQYRAYGKKVNARQKRAYRYFHNGMINNSIFVAKTQAPYATEDENKVFLNPNARVEVDKKTSDLLYPSNQPSKLEKKKHPGPEYIARTKPGSTGDVVESLAKTIVKDNSRIGVDVEIIEDFNIDNDTFVERNFTAQEQEYCQNAADPRSSFAGKWSAKEAVFKSLGVEGKGGGAALKDIEIPNDGKGAPFVRVSCAYSLWPLFLLSK